MQKYIDLAFEQATLSKAKKRKVGAVITIKAHGVIEPMVITGYNHNPNGESCEDENGNTVESVVHAEVAAIAGAEVALKHVNFDMSVLPHLYVTHQPCENCLDKFFQFVHFHYHTGNNVDMRKLVTVANTGMKFDANKLRFDLIPAIATESLATVLTYGAKKYKPNNWRSVDPQRYIAAFERHWHAYISGEMLDKESGLPHLAHCMTNLTFLLELGYKPEQQQTLADYCKNL